MMLDPAAATQRAQRRFAVPPSHEKAALLGRLGRINSAHVVNGNFLRAKRAFEDLLTDAEAGLHCEVTPLPEGRALVITAPSFCGKSHVLDRMVLDSRLLPFEADGLRLRPFLWVRAPSPCNNKTLGLAFLDALGARPLRQLTDIYLIWHAVRCQLVAQGVLVVLIDEFHNVLVGKNRVELDKLSATMKSLLVGEALVLPPENVSPAFASAVLDRGERSPVWLILAGTEKVETFGMDFSTEDREQFSRRCRTVPFRDVPVKDSGTDGRPEYTGLDKFIRNVSDEMGIPVAESLLSHDGLKRFYKAGSRQLGRAAHLLKDGARFAVRSGGVEVGRIHLASAFEDLYKTGPLRNCFLVADIDKCPFPPSPREKEGRGREAA